ncbi:uncharacterized protein LOC144884073 [Branchiostoma floridae x Branchiostoma japonicum]
MKLQVVLMFFCGFPVLEGAKKKKDLEIQVDYRPEDCSVRAALGDTVSVHYTGYLDSGAIFDSSRQEGREPIAFQLGARKVIPGWEQGIVGMCVGEKRRLVIPPHLAYGKEGRSPVIPPQATLTFDTELVTIDRVSSADTVLSFLSFAAVPLAVLGFVYYLYNKASTAPTKKDLKEERKNKKRK